MLSKTPPAASSLSSPCERKKETEQVQCRPYVHSARSPVRPSDSRGRRPLAPCQQHQRSASRVPSRFRSPRAGRSLCLRAASGRVRVSGSCFETRAVCADAKGPSADVALSQKLAEELQYENEASAGEEPEFLTSFKAQSVWTVRSPFFSSLVLDPPLRWRVQALIPRQLEDTPGNDEVTFVRKFGSETCVFLPLLLIHQLPSARLTCLPDRVGSGSSSPSRIFRTRRSRNLRTPRKARRAARRTARGRTPSAARSPSPRCVSLYTPPPPRTRVFMC